MKYRHLLVVIAAVALLLTSVQTTNAACTSSADCGSGECCIGGGCIAKPPTQASCDSTSFGGSSGANGAAGCTTDTDCAGAGPNKICQTGQCIDKPPEPAIGIPTPPGGSGSIPEIIGRIIRGALGLSGVVALLMFVWGGAQYMLAAGNSEKITKAKQTMVWATLGLVAIFGAYAAVSAILQVVQPTTVR
jgi:hypothetical protein